MKTDITAVANRALDLLAIDPEGAGITMDVVFGLKVYIDSANGKVNIRIERVCGFVMLPTQLEPTEIVESLRCNSIEEARQEFPPALERATANGAIERLLYRKNEFASIELSTGRQDKERFPGIRKRFGTADSELLEFVSRVTSDAIAWGEGESKARSLSLWFYPGDDSSAVYATIQILENGFQIKLEDRVSYPWKETKTTVSTTTEVGESIGSFLSKRHAFEFSTLRVYFAHTQIDESERF